MHSSRRMFGKRCRAKAILAAAAASLPAFASASNTDNWIGWTSDWNTPTNWDSGVVPGAGDRVNITNTLGASQTITYDYSGATVTLGPLSINNTGGGFESLSMTTASLALTASNQYIGGNPGGTGTGIGVVSQSAGSNTATSAVFVGYNSGDIGTYALSGAGTLSSVAGPEYLGLSGTGYFNQSGGTNRTAPNYLALGYNAGGTGVYTLSGAGSLTAYGEYVGFRGAGVFNQSGGINILATIGAASSLTLGYESSSTGSYLLSGNGTLSADGPSAHEYVGFSGTGVFAQSGGKNSLFQGYLDVGYNQGSTGSYTLSGNGSLSANFGEHIGVSGTGNFDQSGGDNFISGGNGVSLGINIGSTGTYTLTGNGVLNCSLVSLGGDGTGKFNQTGGTTQLFVARIGDNSDSFGTYNLSGTGTSSIQNGFVGYNGTGVFNQSGGLNKITSSLYIAYENNSSGSFTLSGTGSLSVVGSESVGNSSGSNGNYDQNAGNSTIGSDLYLGIRSTATGTFVISGGRASIGGGAYVGGTNSASGGIGVLTVNQSGQLSVAGTLKVWNRARANLDVPNTTVGNLSIVGNGIVNLNGGLTMNYGSPANDPISSVVSYLQSGYNGGNWTGTSGIISTSAQNQTGPAVTLGYADGNVDSGAAAGLNQIVVKYTLVGDANLDGLANFGDLVAVIQNFNKAGTDWAQGNFFYGASTNFGDLVAVIQNFNKTLPAPSGSAVELGGTTIPIVQSTDVQLPEPGGMALLAAGLLSRRRRKDFSPQRAQRAQS